MKTYIVTYETKETIIAEELFKVKSIKEAKKYAQFYKRHTPEIMREKNAKTTIRPYKEDQS